MARCVTHGVEGGLMLSRWMVAVWVHTLGLGYLDTRAGSPVCYRGPLGESNAVLFWVALRLQTEMERGKTCISLHGFAHCAGPAKS